MDEPKDVTDSSPEEVIEEETPVVSEDVVEEDEETPIEPAPVKAERTVPYDRFKEVNDELSKLKKQTAPKQSLDVEDYIDISASLEGLDQREKSFLAEQHKLTGKPLSELRNNEDFQLWQTAYRSKVEKEKTLRPSGTQPEVEQPRKLSEVLTDPKTPQEEKEKLMKQFGLYRDPGSPPSQRKTLMP